MNRRPANYNTKQGEAVLAYLAAQNGAYVTAAQVVEHFHNGGDIVSRTTIYRQLEKLVNEGKARKYTFDGISGTCFQYINKLQSGQDFCHLKCEGCGGLFSLECDEVDHISRHILDAHAFQVNDTKTVFYGKCRTCLHK